VDRRRQDSCGCCEHRMEYTGLLWTFFPSEVVDVRPNGFCGRCLAYVLGTASRSPAVSVRRMQQAYNRRLVQCDGKGNDRHIWRSRGRLWRWTCWSARYSRTPSPSTRARTSCRNRFYTIPIDEFRTACKHHEHGSTLLQAEKQSVKQGTMHQKVFGSLTEHQTAGLSRMRGMLRCDSTISNVYKHLMY